MIRSMTAFTRLSGATRNNTWFLEIRSLNHRYFEFSFKAPPALYALESQVRSLVQQYLRRGKVSLAISEEKEENSRRLSIDHDYIAQCVREARRIKRTHELAGDLTLSHILGFPRVFTPEKKAVDPEKEWKSLERILRKALKSAVKMKEEEGCKLRDDMLQRLTTITDTVSRVHQLASGSAEKYFSQLKKKLSRLIAETHLEDEKLYREAALLAERSDITEEIVRLQSHLQSFRQRLSSRDEIGRELDFLCQEMNREINTMGSKTQFLQISTDVIFMKKELEKIREQVQNIE